MKKVVSFVLVSFMSVIILGGCFFKDKQVVFNPDEDYKNVSFATVNTENDLLLNIESALKSIKAYNLEVLFNNNSNNKTITGNVSVILGGLSKETSMIGNLNLNDSNLKIYLNEGIINITYPFTTIDVGVRDNLSNLKDEFSSILLNYGLEIKNLDDYLDTASFINFDLVEWFENHDVSYNFDEAKNIYDINIVKNSEVILLKVDSYFRPVEVDFENENNSFNLKVTYPKSKVTLNFPASLRGITFVSLQRALNMAGKESLEDLIG